MSRLASIILVLLPCCAWAGVIVEKLEPGSTLAASGVKIGDVIEYDDPVTFSLTEATLGAQWRAQVRPRLEPELLQEYRRAEGAIDGEQWGVAATAYESLATASQRKQRTAVACWFLEKAAAAHRSQQNYEAAEALTDRALKLADAAGLPNVAAWSLQAAGADLWRKGQHVKSEARIAAALRIREANNAPPLVIAQSLGSLAILTSSHSEYERAREYANRMLAVAQSQAPEGLVEAEAHHQLGNIALWTDDLDAALAQHRKALELRTRLDPAGLAAARSHASVANVYWRRGELDLARECYEMALAIFQRLEPGGSLMAQALMSLGYVEQDRRDLEAAERYQSQALAVYERIAPDAEQVASIRNALGQIQRLRGDLPAARILGEQALAQYRRIAPGGLQESLALAGLGEIALDQRDPALAREYQTKSLELARRLTPNGPRVGERLLALARIENDQGERGVAERHAIAALAVFERDLPDGLGVVEALTMLGRLQAEGENPALARAQLGRAIDIAQRIAPGTMWEAEPLHRWARLELRGGERARALELFARALDAFEAQRAVLGGADTAQALFGDRHAHYYRDYIELLLESNLTDEAFSVAERYRARSLLDAMKPKARLAGARLPKDVAASRERAAYIYEKALARLRAYSPTKGARPYADEVRAVQTARSELNAVEARIRALSTNEPAGLTRPWSVAQIRAHLAADAAVLSYVETNAGVYVLALDGAAHPGEPSIKAVRVAKSSAELQTEIAALGVLLRAHVETAASESILMQRLAAQYQRLLAPLSDTLRAKRKVIIVADGALHRVPWSALRSPRGGFLIDDFTVAVQPSATYFAQLAAAEQRTKREPQRIVAFAATDVSGVGRESAFRSLADGGAMPALPSAAAEVAAIKQIYGKNAQVFYGADATEALAKQLAPTAGVLHFAAHAVAVETSPLDSFVALAGDRTDDEHPVDGQLYAWEVMAELRLQSSLVVLSACETAGGRETAGEGLLGLTHAFHHAGARGVVSSLWPVSDRATTALMKKFYERLAAGEPADVALRTAQLHMARSEDGSWLDRLFGAQQRRSWRHPFYWAGFQLSGSAR